MNFRKLVNSAGIVSWAASMCFSGSVFAAETKISEVEPSIAHRLGWVTDPTLNICNGYYQELEQIINHPIPADLTTAETKVSAENDARITASGASVFTGNVTVEQPGRYLSADQVTLVRTPQGEISTVDLVGHVYFAESGKLIIGEHANIDLINRHNRLHNAYYHFAKRTDRGHILNAWGGAEFAQEDAKGIITLTQGTYTTCAPVKQTWHVKSKHLTIDRDEGVGVSRNTTLYIGKVPILYSPYLSFPIDDRRKSGFLFPTFAVSSKDGSSVTVPYYFNLAPNYDFTFMPSLITKRGIQAAGQFRFLTERSQGYLYGSFLPSDSEFRDFRDSAAAKFGVSPTTTPFLDDLSGFSDDRGFISWQSDTQIDQHWSNSLTINYVTDDYYFQDFGNSPVLTNTDQLLNQADLNYSGEYTRFRARVQGYQTLHLINTVPVTDQYLRLPQLNFYATLPAKPMQTNIDFEAEYINFDHPGNFLTGASVPTGQRFFFAPTASLPVIGPSMYITPRLQASLTSYDLENQVMGKSSDIHRVIPIFDINAGLYFDRETSLHGKRYKQTLEPRFFYLYVPTVNQNDIPTFDTRLPAFNFERLFVTNRFTGIDRIGDANQVSISVTTRLLDAHTSVERLRASIGQAYYLEKRRVCLTDDCSDDPTVNDTFSPIVAELIYYLTPNWSAVGDLAWDPSQGQANTASASIHYQNGERRIAHVGFDFVRRGDILDITNIDDSVNNLSRLHVAASWPISQHWQVIGHWKYNISHDNSQAYSYGLEYESCCIAFRMVASRVLRAEMVNGETDFDNTYYFQLQFKGLGNVGNNNPSSLLNENVPGYYDRFRK